MTGESKDKTDDPASDDTAPLEQATSVIEWVAAAFGAMVFVAMIGYMAFIGLNEVEGAPRIEFTATAPVRQGSVFLIGFTATNTGETTATGLAIRATLTDGEKEVESHEATIDYLPAQSTRGGGFYFEHDPAGLRFTIAATSYLDP